MGIFLFPTLVALAVAGCGSATETAQEDLASPPDTIQPQIRPPMIFETRTDTVNTERTGLHRAPDLTHSGPESAGTRTAGSLESRIRFMVQIGAFKDPEKASKIQQAARERFHVPVLNDYHTTYDLYQIRIGFFETRKAAHAFKEQMEKEFPADYKDSWVVQLKR